MNILAFLKKIFIDTKLPTFTCKECDRHCEVEYDFAGDYYPEDCILLSKEENKEGK